MMSPAGIDGLQVAEISALDFEAVQAQQGHIRMAAALAWKAARKADGSPAYASLDEALAAPIRVIKRLAEAATEVNGLAEDVSGNSPAGPGADSPSS